MLPIHRRHKLLTLLIGTTLIAAGCQPLGVRDDIVSQAPHSLSNSENTDPSPGIPPSNWLKHFGDDVLQRWVNEAVSNNFDLQEAAARVEAARQQQLSTRSNLWPSLDLDVSSQRQKTTIDGNDYQNSANISASIAWELDLWGRLGDVREAADFRFQAESARFHASQLSLAGQIAKAWYHVIGDHQLSQLLQERVNNLKTNLDIIRSGYRQGINNALDVYLAQSDLASEQNSLQQQQALELSSIRALQLLLGSYPSGKLEHDSAFEFPGLPSLDDQQLLSDHVRYRPDLQASYLELLASDRDLAVAHKNRFPSFRLTGSGGDSSDELKNLLDSSSLAWNILGSLSQPLFAGGSLKAAERQQQAVVRQREQQYLKALHTAFNEVEQSLTNEKALKQQLVSVESARRYAEAAEELAFEEYRQGLQSYTSVLEAQRRAFSAQNTVISINNQLLQNRINLYLALGGSYQ